MAQSISLLLTTYNRTKDCMECLLNLKNQKIKDIQTILLDDYHISDPVLKMFCEKEGIEYIHTGAQKGGKVHWRVPGFAYNIGSKFASGEYLVLGGAEIYHLTNNCLQQMINTGTVSYPRIYDEPVSTTGTNWVNYPRLNAKYPFCLGIPASLYKYIGGYDEDMIGYCFDDTEFSARVFRLKTGEEVDADAVHLYNIRGVENRGDPRLTNKSWLYNKRIYESKLDSSVFRNVGREWGKL